MYSFIIPSMYTRFEPLMQLLDDIQKYYPNYLIIGCLQKFKPEEVETLKKIPNSHWIVSDELLGTSTPRILAIKKGLEMGVDVFINLDDDMSLCDKTKYEPIINFIKNNKGVGLVSGNWRKSFNMIDKIQDIKDEFVKQKIVYTGGGLLYNREIAKLMIELEGNTICDNTDWSVTSYINGYENFRYLGSFAEHRICQKDGRNLYLKENPNYRLCDARYVTMKKEKNNRGWLIPLDKDLTPFAHELHKKNKKSDKND